MGRGRGGGGRGRGGRGRGGRGGGRGGRGGDNRRNWGTRDEVTRKNEKYEGYYNRLEVVDEPEREAFWNAMRSDLPNSFRFAGSRGHALTVQKRLIEHYIPLITSVEWQGQLVAPPLPIDWYPDQLAWSMTTPKSVIRKFAPFASFQKFLVSENNVGNITRQEIVSMIPPLLLDVRPGMTVLDLCAAPGSKSAQIIELLHSGEETRVQQVLGKLASRNGREIDPASTEADVEKEQASGEDDWSDHGRSTGLLIANDVDYRRAQMLVHQCKRLNSPNLLVTNHDAILFPSIKIPSESGMRYLKFDRILADVPCSGDGTVRKNLNVWRDWTPQNGIGLHATQVRILVRSLTMLKVGGRVVYSTCSLNPIENEAVIGAAIERCGGIEKVKLIDMSHALPGLKRQSGLSRWEVMDRNGKYWDSWDDAKEKDSNSKLSESMFPPQPEQEIPLDRCIRIYPHLQDTGGFFITVLEKQTEIKAKPEGPKKTEAKATTPPVSSLINELQARTEDGSNGAEPIEALDKLLPSTNDPTLQINDSGNALPAARQNMENAPSNANVSDLKRQLDAEADAMSAAKRPKFREEVDDVAPEGTSDRLVHWPPPPAAELALTAHQNDTPATIPPKKRSNQPHEEPFKYLDPNHEELQIIYKFYQLSPDFPRDRFMVRNASGQPAKAIYYTSSLAGDILKENEGKGIKFVHCGVKMFVKQDTQNQPDACPWRIQSEGLPIVEPWVGAQRIVNLTQRPTLRKLLLEMFPKVAHDGWEDLGEIGERVRDMSVGCCVLRVLPTDNPDGFAERLVMPLWRGMASLNLMLPKEERRAMLLRLFDDDSPLVDYSKDRFDKKDHGTENGADLAADGDEAEEDDEVDEEEGGVSLETEGQAHTAEDTVATEVAEDVAPTGHEGDT